MYSPLMASSVNIRQNYDSIDTIERNRGFRYKISRNRGFVLKYREIRKIEVFIVHVEKREVFRFTSREERGFPIKIQRK